MHPHVTRAQDFCKPLSVVCTVINPLWHLLRYTIDLKTESDLQQRDGLPKVQSIDRRIAVVKLLLSNRRKPLREILGLKDNSLYHKRGAH